jgi:hypothetical protein
MLAACPYLVDHQIVSGMSFGVFDTQYGYRTTDGWGTVLEPRCRRVRRETARANGFPLVSVALSYDALNSLDHDKMAPLVATLPRYTTIFEVLGARDTRDPQTWQPTGPSQDLFRNATSTRHEYEGRGIMAGLARWFLRSMSL